MSLEDKRSNPTFELTRRRESKHPPPHQVSYKTRYRRSRPTICYARAGSQASNLSEINSRQKSIAPLTSFKSNSSTVRELP